MACIKEMKSLTGSGRPGESVEVSVGNGTSNGYSKPRAKTHSRVAEAHLVPFHTPLFPPSLRVVEGHLATCWFFYKFKVPCWAVILLLSVVIVLIGIFAPYVIHLHSQSLCHAECPSDWIHVSSRCYHLSQNKTTWIAAGDACNKHRAALVVITDNTMNDLNKLNINDDFWIGLRRDQNKWKWVDGSDYEQEVSDYRNDTRLNCAYMNGRIRALDCSTLRRFICIKTVRGLLS
ncbi:uncharacterized protein ACMZJ9_007435 [Mantella aurantiaca]